MEYSRVLPLAFAGALLLAGCAVIRPTPPEVRASYEQLKSVLNEDTPGESIQKLEAFRKECARYEISTAIQQDITNLRGQAPGRFHKARFDRLRFCRAFGPGPD